MPSINHNNFIKSTTLFLSVTLLGCAVQSSYGWNFIVFCDSRNDIASEQVSTNILTEIARATTNETPAFILFPGDMVAYATPYSLQKWKDAMAPIYDAGIPVYPVMGNHEINDVTAFTNAFGADIPDNGPPGEINRTYAVAHSNVLVLALDTYVNFHRVNQPWINSILATNIQPHVFAFGHAPAFKVSHTDTLDDYPAERDAFWCSLAYANATAYFCGHDHFYDHMRLDDGDGNPLNDIHQYITGTAGAPLYGDGLYNGTNSVWTPQRIFHEAQYGYAVVEIDDMNVTITWKQRIAPGVYEATPDTYTRQVQIQRPILSLKRIDNNMLISVTRVTPDTHNTVLRNGNLDGGIWTPLYMFTISSNSYDRLLPARSQRFYKVRSE